jgi:hypothetical protein
MIGHIRGTNENTTRIYNKIKHVVWCPEGDLNPHDRLRSADFKSAVSADFTIRAWRGILLVAPS